MSKTSRGRGTARRRDPRDSGLFVLSLEKGLAVLKAFDAQHREMSLPELAAAAGVSKSAAQRFAHTLEVLGYLRRSARTRRLSLAPRVLDIGFAYLQSHWLIDHANPFLLELNRTCGETVNLSEPDGASMVFVARFTSQRHMPIHMPVGRRLPMFCTAAGRAYLSAIDRTAAREILRASDRQRYTPHTIVDLGKLDALLDEARELGYAWANEEYYRGDLNFAIPVRDARGTPLAAVNVSLPTSRWTMEAGREEIVPHLLQTARVIVTSAPE